jgi:putative transposase
MGHK